LDQRRDATTDVTRWARDMLGADEDTIVKVTRPHCGDPDCGELTTILLMRRDNATRMIKIAKSLESVTEIDVRAALTVVAHPELQQTSQRDS
jgi:hypothetical protein